LWSKYYAELNREVTELYKADGFQKKYQKINMSSENQSPMFSTELGVLPGTPYNSVFPHYNKNRFSDDPNAAIGVLNEFTEIYKKYSNGPVGRREVECLRVQYPLGFCDIEKHDLFAGRWHYPAIGFGPQAHTYFGYYLAEHELDKLLHHPGLDHGKQPVIEELRRFWEQESDAIKTRRAFPEKMQRILDSDAWFTEPIIGAPLYRMSGTQLDFDKLIRLGIPGLKAEILDHKARTTANTEAWHFYDNLEGALDLFAEVAAYFAEMASKQAKTASPERQKELVQMGTILRNISVSKPKTFREAIQLMFLYTGISGTYNFGRMDEYLGDLYAEEIRKGSLTDEEAIRLLSNLWYLMDAKGQIWDCRVIIGGKGRSNENNANQLTKVIMETTKRVKGIVPQTTLRFYKEQDPELYEMALDVIATGNPYPMLYNDDVNIPAVMNAFKLPYEEAIDYVPFGCGEYVIYHKSVGTPSGVVNMLQALLVTLHRGINPTSEKTMGLPPDQVGSFETFENLFNTYKKQVEYYAEQLAWQEKLEYDIAGTSANYLFLSLLFDDCLERGMGIYSGGVRYLGGTIESYGNTNVADSLVAIKKLVYEEKKLTLDILVEILDQNFEGFEKERRWMLDCPKFGNDDETADSMREEVDKHLNTFVRNMAPKVGLHSYLNVIINNDANTTMGLLTAASPDGRKAFTPMANGNAASGGADKNGLTAYLNSIVKPDNTIHAGAVQNLKLSRDLLTTYRSQTEALLQTYFEKGGAQLMINCINRDDLENAMKEPEKYGSLIVRVGGFSARFVDLPGEVQMEILGRTLY
jgi:pyruvate-formate lyase